VKDLEPGLRLITDEWLSPSFPEAELDRVRTRRLTSLAQEKMSPGAMAQNALAASLFGRKHPYGNNLFGREADVKSITRDDLVRLHKAKSATGRLAVVVAGDTTRGALEPLLESTLGALPKADRETLTGKPSVAPSPVAARLVFVHLRGATQSTVLVAGAGTDAAYKERDALAVMNSIFGGAFASRVNMNLREKHAYTYGARSRFAMRRGAGPFTVGGAIVAEHTGEAISEIMNELDAMVKTDVSADELALAKENIRLGMPGRFETVADVTSAVTDIPAYGLPLDEFSTRSARIDAVGAKEVRKVASAFLVKEKLRVIVVGDRDKVLPQLQKLGLGEPLELDAYGDPAPKNAAPEGAAAPHAGAATAPPGGKAPPKK
jgi:zinc protease